MSAVYNTSGFVIKISPKGESSLIAHLFTEKEGKLILIAKGGRQSKSQFRGLLEPFSCLNIHYNGKKDRPYQFLSHAEFIDPYLHLKQSGDALLYGSIILEIIYKTQENHPDAAVFKLLRLTLEAMNKGLTPAYVHWAFILHYLQTQGASLNLNSCYGCGNKPKSAYFYPYEGMIYCENCRDRHLLNWELPASVLITLRSLAADEFHIHAPSDEDKELINRILWNTLATRFENCRTLKSVNTLRKVL